MEIIKHSFKSWNALWGTGLYQYLFLAAVVYLLFRKREKKICQYLLVYMAVTIFLFFFPVTGKIIKKCIGKKVYWRVLWLLPVIPVIALAMTEWLKERRKILQAVFGALFVGCMILCGKGIYAAGNYGVVHNFQKVPDEVAAVCNLVRSDAGEEAFMLVADDYLSSYIRVYDPSIHMLFGRRGKGAAGKMAKRLYGEINAPGELNYRHLGILGKRKVCNYMVVRIPNEEQKAELEKYEYQEIGTVNQYAVFRLGGKNENYRNPLLFREKADTLDTINNTKEEK